MAMREEKERRSCTERFVYSPPMAGRNLCFFFNGPILQHTQHSPMPTQLPKRRTHFISATTRVTTRSTPSKPRCSPHRQLPSATQSSVLSAARTAAQPQTTQTIDYRIMNIFLFVNFPPPLRVAWCQYSILWNKNTFLAIEA